jgi:signal transduction histidine kinase
MLVRLSVPAGGDLRAVAVDVAKRVSEYLREGAPDTHGLRAAIEGVTSKVAPAATDTEITFDFRELNGELQIEAHCGSRSSEVRCPLPA